MNFNTGDRLRQNFYKSQNQQMQRVEGVAEKAKPRGVIPLFPSVEPKGQEGYQSQALSDKEKFVAEDRQLIAVSSQKLGVDVPKTYRLPCKAPPFSSTEKVECEGSKNAGVIKVHEGDESCHVSDHDCGEADKNTGDNAAFRIGYPSRFLTKRDQANGNQKAPQYVLVQGIEYPTSHGKIEGDFRDNGKHQQSQNVFFEAFGVKISLHNHKSENGKG